MKSKRQLRTNNQKREGFTLVEIAIVLVIIGLLIGGILAAQSMIQTAKINSQVRQLQQFDIAVSNFRTQFNYLPGDSPTNNFGITVVSQGSGFGNGNGIVEDYYTSTSPGTYRYAQQPGGELPTFWPQLQIGVGLYANHAQFISNPEFHSWMPAPHNTPGIAIPESAMGFANGGITIMDHLDTQYKSFYLLCAFQTTDRKRALTPAIALAIDSKMDDGLTGQPTPSTYQGTIMALDPEGGQMWLPGNEYGTIGSSCFDALDPSHYGSASTPSCCLMIAILGSNGGT